MSRRPHTENDCDEHCACCTTCYQARRLEICDRLCPHADPEDDDTDDDTAATTD